MKITIMLVAIAMAAALLLSSTGFMPVRAAADLQVTPDEVAGPSRAAMQ
jgi:hypothetical protein